MNRIALTACLFVLMSGAAEAQQPPAASGPPQTYTLPPLDDLQATRNRPLFAPNRQPDAVPEKTDTETTVTQESADSLPYDLTGVVMGTDVAIAILLNRDTQETVRLRQGETLESWSIQEVAQRYIVLRQDEREIRLELFQAKADGSTPVQPPQLPATIRRPPPPPPPQQTNSGQSRRNVQLQNRQQRRGIRTDRVPQRPQTR